jgi:hypothetical protein
VFIAVPAGPVIGWVGAFRTGMRRPILAVAMDGNWLGIEGRKESDISSEIWSAFSKENPANEFGSDFHF